MKSTGRLLYHADMSIEPSFRFTSFLRDRRRQLGLSQGQVASSVGVRVQVYGRWERGERAVPSEQRDAVARALEVRVSDLPISSAARRRFPFRRLFRRGDPIRGRYPIGGTLDNCLRIAGWIDAVHRSVRSALDSRHYAALMDEFPRDTGFELLLLMLLIADGGTLEWTSPAEFHCPLLVLDDFLPDYGGNQKQWAVCWVRDGEHIVVFGQVRLKAPYVKASPRVDLLVFHKLPNQRGQWLYVELDGRQHPTQQDLDAERAEGLLIPELRYDNQKLRSPEWYRRFLDDVRQGATEGARRERDRKRQALVRRRQREQQMARRLAAS